MTKKQKLDSEFRYLSNSFKNKIWPRTIELKRHVYLQRILFEELLGINTEDSVSRKKTFPRLDDTITGKNLPSWFVTKYREYMIDADAKATHPWAKHLQRCWLPRNRNENLCMDILWLG